MRQEEAACLARLSGKLGVSLTPSISERVIAFCRLLLKWNERVNLTGALAVAEVVGEHVVDAFAMSRLVPSGASVVDVGAGGGLPGLAFAILRPDTRITMVEPRAKRVAFLHTAVREAQLASAVVFRGRADALDRGGFDVAASRATFPPEEWLGVGLGLVRPGGHVLVFAGDCWNPENSSLNAVNQLRYETATGRSRWIGAFCST